MSNNEDNEKKEKRPLLTWIGKHSDAVMVIGSILGAVLWINGQFNELKTDIAVIKTVLIMKNIMPEQVACKSEEKAAQKS